MGLGVGIRCGTEKEWVKLKMILVEGDLGFVEFRAAGDT